MAHQNYDDSEGVWRTVGGRRIFIKNGQSLTDAMRASGKFKVTDEGDVEEDDYDITEQFMLKVRPDIGDIEIADYTIGSDGQKYTKENGVFYNPTKDDIEIGNWFKNTIWGKCKLQKAINKPNGIRSADVVILENCPLFDEQFIEIKSLKGTQRIDGVDKRIKSGKGQSENILLDISDTLMNKKEVIKRISLVFNKQEWIKALIVKDGDKVKKVFSKK